MLHKRCTPDFSGVNIRSRERRRGCSGAMHPAPAGVLHCIPEHPALTRVLHYISLHCIALHPSYCIDFYCIDRPVPEKFSSWRLERGLVLITITINLQCIALYFNLHNLGIPPITYITVVLYYVAFLVNIYIAL